MDARELDPSMVLGFYCRTRGDLDELCLELELLQRRAGAAPLITVASNRDLSNGASREWKPVGATTRAAPEPTRGSQSELSRAESEEETEARGAESEDDEWEFL
mmetsp:Transcript_13676/g.58424  ORF Transcript_13676/g.58424 Transcript_13676/m.58424 type:complete len:104 (+) Transcript_13676:2409-2720(+)